MGSHPIYKRHVTHVMNVLLGPPKGDSKGLRFHDINNLERIINQLGPGWLQVWVIVGSTFSGILHRETLWKEANYVSFLNSSMVLTSPNASSCSLGPNMTAILMTLKCRPSDSEIINTNTLKMLQVATNFTDFFSPSFSPLSVLLENPDGSLGFL